MENNLNQKVIRRYSREFAEKVCSAFYASHESVDNEQIMQVQPVKQVNLFVVKNLFDQWQQEAGRLKSPYFDYSAPKVAEAMERLKNTLSRHILLDRETYQALLTKSTEETLRLILSPYDYYKDLVSIDEELLTLDYLKATSRYMKINPFIIQELINRLEQENMKDLTHEKARKMLDQVVESLDKEPDDVEPHIDAFAEVHSLTLEDLYGTGAENKEKQPAEEKQTVQEEPPAQEDHSDEEPRPLSKEEKEIRTLHDDLFNKEQSTLADLHLKQKISDIRKHLSINQRFMFVNTLFEGDADRFNEVVDHIERQENADDAIHYLHAAFSEWDKDSEEAVEFFSIVRRRLD